MEIHHLRYFVAVAERLSFSRAAEDLHMAVSPLSRSVRDLERDLDQRLFDRDSHHVELTAAGTALLPMAKDVLARFDDIPWQMRRILGAARLTAYIGIPPGLHRRIRDRLVELERGRLGRYDIKRWPGHSRALLSAVQRGDIALALVHLPAHAEGVEVAEVMREPLGAVLPAAEFAGRTSVALRELTGHTYVSTGSDMLPVYFDQIRVRLEAAGITRGIVLDSADYSGVSEFVANGSAFSISMIDPMSEMRRYRGEGTVVLPFEDFSPVLTTGLAWRTDRAAAGRELHDLVAAARAILADPDPATTSGTDTAPAPGPDSTPGPDTGSGTPAEA
ncbi:DNA-binding transcriptional LysR family regulator [Nocardiopsis mwathae]|uniref:DNA-binding transcriptional LysR family regulator n=1 Tax=Nocardiopsis mwathae TaxID=1472723 RepID=A0A7W9YE99_9ACTN|nr:LysR family transcriptional regulator [Nocardiopsis mwathae]MBB6170512.1 DNA-binding transcriptional LysR family regulator [Nocardiopsis mwathae]